MSTATEIFNMVSKFADTKGNPLLNVLTQGGKTALDDPQNMERLGGLMQQFIHQLPPEERAKFETLAVKQVQEKAVAATTQAATQVAAQGAEAGGGIIDLIVDNIVKYGKGILLAPLAAIPGVGTVADAAFDRLVVPTVKNLAKHAIEGIV